MFLVLVRERCELEEWRGRCAEVGLELGVDIVLLPITPWQPRPSQRPVENEERRNATKM